MYCAHPLYSLPLLMLTTRAERILTSIHAGHRHFEPRPHAGMQQLVDRARSEQAPHGRQPIGNTGRCTRCHFTHMCASPSHLHSPTNKGPKHTDWHTDADSSSSHCTQVTYGLLRNKSITSLDLRANRLSGFSGEMQALCSSLFSCAAHETLCYISALQPFFSLSMVTTDTHFSHLSYPAGAQLERLLSEAPHLQRVDLASNMLGVCVALCCFLFASAVWTVIRKTHCRTTVMTPLIRTLLVFYPACTSAGRWCPCACPINALLPLVGIPGPAREQHRRAGGPLLLCAVLLDESNEWSPQCISASTYN